MDNRIYADYEFNYASFKLEPYKGVYGSSSSLLKDIINKLNEPKGKVVIDKNKNQKNTLPRRLLMISCRIERGLRCYGRIALFKNKIPYWLNTDEDIVEKIERPENRQFIDVTHFAINFDLEGEPVFMIEFNDEGPRIADILYYLRQVSKQHNIAKYMSCIPHLNLAYDQLDNSIRNVFELVVKVKSVNSQKIKWLPSIQNISSETGYRDVRLQFFYDKTKDKAGDYVKNIRGLDFARSMLGWLGKSKANINDLEDLKMVYQDEKDNIVDLDFKKNKVTSIVNVPLVDGVSYDEKEFIFAVAQEFNKYLKTGETNCS